MDVNKWLLDYFKQWKASHKRLILPNARKFQVTQVGLTFPGSLSPIQLRSQERLFLSSRFLGSSIEAFELRTVLHARNLMILIKAL